MIQDNFKVVAADIDANGDTVRLCRLQSNFRPISIKIANDDLDTGVDLVFALGLYRVNFDGSFGLVRDQQLFSAGFAMFNFNKLTELLDDRDTDVQRQLVGDRVWEWAGDPRDRIDSHDLVLTGLSPLGVPGAQAGTIAFQVMYSVE